MGKVMVVTSETLVGSHVTRRLHELSEAGPIEVHVIVPVTGTRGEEMWRVLAEAETHLNSGLEAIRRLGIEAEGRVMHSDPVAAVRLLADTWPDLDRVLCSTKPLGMSRWLALDLPHRLARAVDVEVEHLVGTPEDASPPILLRRPRVLLVEDDEADIELARAAIDASSITVDLEVCRDGAQGLAHMTSEKRPDLALVDLKMPVMDGHTMLERIAEELGLDLLHDMRVVIVSSSANEADRTRAHGLGAAAYIVKDPDFERFCETIDSLLLELVDGLPVSI